MNFGAVWGVWGVAEFKLRLQADFNLSSHTLCTLGRVRRMKIYAKMDPKSDPKIDIWALRGRIFAILGGFLRSPIFYEFSVGKKLLKSEILGPEGRQKVASVLF